MIIDTNLLLRALTVLRAVLPVKKILTEDFLHHYVLSKEAMAAIRGVSEPASSILVGELRVLVIRCPEGRINRMTLNHFKSQGSSPSS